jgi:predicted amidohydrolase YtcJ
VRGVLLGLALLAAAPACAADRLYVNGSFITLEPNQPRASAMLVRGERILALGESAALLTAAPEQTEVIDLRGRTVIPGLVDSHIHAIRAGLSYATEVHWTGVATIPEALQRLRDAAGALPPGGWIIVAGGWTALQFSERRRPTQEEVEAAAPDHRVYIQHLYSAVLLSKSAVAALDLANNGALLAQLKTERESGEFSGWFSGDTDAITALFDLLPRPSLQLQMEGTKAFFRVLNSLGLTGVIDPGGYNLPLEAYGAVRRLARDQHLSLRVTYSLSAPEPGAELADFERLTTDLPMGAGDGLLRFNGLGENVTWGMYNNDKPSPEQQAKLEQVLRLAVRRRLGVTFHWVNDRSASKLLDVLERVNAQTPIADLRWSIAHLHDASLATLLRMKALGVGWLFQNALYFRGLAFVRQRGEEAARLSPPIVSAINMGLPLAAGTDAYRVMSFHPFVALQWMLDGKSVDGQRTRDAREIPTREQALATYTLGGAWVAHAERERGSLAVGKLADFAVLSEDYMSVPVERIGALRSLLTVVGGRVVFAAAPFEGMEE